MTDIDPRNPENWSTTGRFATMQAGEFGAEVKKLWGVAESLIQPVVKAVEGQQITPLQGVKILSCTAGTLLGYEEFHPHSGSAANPEVVAAMYDQISSGTRERELAGSRS